jgi:hypothetical protein
MSSFSWSRCTSIGPSTVLSPLIQIRLLERGGGLSGGVRRLLGRVLPLDFAGAFSAVVELAGEDP